MGGDEQVLLDLYNSTNGDNWHDKTGWSSHSISLEDEIAGVTVAMRDGELRVTAIDMQKVTTNSKGETLGNNLTGALPSSLGNLKYVEKLNVKQNRLSGKLPPEIGNMTRLKRLSLAGQQCEIDLDNTEEWYLASQTGTCNTVGGGRRLEETNKFSGPLPSAWGNLESIELIEVRRQYLTGTLPESWGNLSTLRGLFIGNSKGSGPDLIGGEIPDSWGGMVSMQWFSLPNYHGNARFKGSFPQSAQDNWSNLNHVNITTNEFEGPVPVFPNSTNITYANFGNNNFTGGFPITYSNTGQMTESGEKALNEQPLNTELRQNYPNPFNPTTQIEFALTDVQKVSLEVYDMAGRRVATLVDDVLQAGNHTATFDASNLASGVYLYRFISNTHQFTRKMTVVK